MIEYAENAGHSAPAVYDSVALHWLAMTVISLFENMTRVGTDSRGIPFGEISFHSSVTAISGE